MSIGVESTDTVMVRFRNGTADTEAPTLRHVHKNSEDGVTSPEEDEAFPEDDDVNDGDDSISKPLMHPRQQRTKVKVQTGNRLCRRIFWPCIYFIIVACSVIALVCLIFYLVNTYANNVLLVKMTHSFWRHDNRTLVGMTNLAVSDVWIVGVPKLITESSFRLIDINQDGHVDVVLGFATGGDKLKEEPLVCEIYFNGSHPCGGGILAIDGVSGAKLWRTYTAHEIFGLNCNGDLDLDGVRDCVGGGRAGTFVAVSGHSGHLLWTFNGTVKNQVMNFYTAQFIADINDDGIPDLLNIHGGDPIRKPGAQEKLGGKLLLMSGRDGSILREATVPDHHESYFSPILYERGDGTQVVLFGTGGETHGGGLWVVTLYDLIKGQINKAVEIYHDNFKGVMAPPVLIDITKDGIRDIVLSTFNSTVVAINGKTYEVLWKYIFPSSETYATPAPGYYNDDDVPDFLVRWQYGPGFPLYYHSTMTILDGKTGKPLIDPFLKDSIGAQTSPLTLSMEGQGHDLFLYWIADCKGHKGEGGEFSFTKDANVHDKTHSDICRLRFKADGFSQMLAIGSNLSLPGAVVYNSLQREVEEHSAWINTSAEAWQFLQTHPRHMQQYLKNQEWLKLRQSGKMPANYDADDKMDFIYDELAENQPSHRNYEFASDDTYSNYDPMNTYETRYQGGRKVINHQRPDATNYPTGNGNRQFGAANIRRKPGMYETPDESYYLSNTGGVQHNNVGRKNGMGGGNYGKGRANYPGMSDGYGAGYQDTDKFYNQISEMMSHILPEEDASQQQYPQMPSEYGKRESAPPGASYSDQTNFGDSSSSHKPSRKKDLSLENWRGIQQHSQSGDSTNPASDVRESPDGRNKERAVNEPPSSGRKRRHVGPHDEGGVQRLISTGTLAPPLLPRDHPEYPHSMDVIFATYWFYPAKTKAILPEDWKCIEEKMKQEKERFDPTSEFYGMDRDRYEHEVEEMCLEQSGHDVSDDRIYQSGETADVYTLQMGQLTIYRLRLKCSCGDPGELDKKKQRCSEFLPFSEQQWASYMGTHGDAHWLPRQPAKPAR